MCWFLGLKRGPAGTGTHDPIIREGFLANLSIMERSLERWSLPMRNTLFVHGQRLNGDTLAFSLPGSEDGSH